METSKTRIKSRLKKKTNPVLVETIKLAMKNSAWLPLAKKLSFPSRKLASVNLSRIEEKTSPGDTVLIPGKVLSSGEISKKIRVCALFFSASAKEKLKKTKSEIVSLAEEIKKNPRAEGIKIIQ